jgi:hypothetical protein
MKITAIISILLSISSHAFSEEQNIVSYNFNQYEPISGLKSFQVSVSDEKKLIVERTDNNPFIRVPAKKLIFTGKLDTVTFDKLEKMVFELSQSEIQVIKNNSICEKRSYGVRESLFVSKGYDYYKNKYHNNLRLIRNNNDCWEYEHVAPAFLSENDISEDLIENLKNLAVEISNK